jgi:hypothetical protein
MKFTLCHLVTDASDEPQSKIDRDRSGYQVKKGDRTRISELLEA